MLFDHTWFQGLYGHIFWKGLLRRWPWKCSCCSLGGSGYRVQEALCQSGFERPLPPKGHTYSCYCCQGLGRTMGCTLSNSEILSHFFTVLIFKTKANTYIRLFFGRFQKTQGQPQKNSRPNWVKKLYRMESTRVDRKNTQYFGVN